MRRIEDVCGKKLPIIALFQAPTVERLAELIRHQTLPEEWPSLVLVQEGSTKPPFFCIHGVFGEVLGFRDLARHLGADQPVYGLQAQGLDGTTRCLTRVEDMAAAYIKEIQQFQPEGPYYLGGFSFGGAIAFEMATQLVEQGEEVAVLALIDTYPPNYQATGSILLKFLGSTPREQLLYIQRKLKYWKDKVVEFVSAQFLPARLKRVRKACAEARRNYAPRKYPGSVLLFRAKERPLGTAHDLYLGWDRLAGGGIEVREIPGDHLSIIDEPQVSYLATELRASLDKAYERNQRAVFERARARA
jgi:aspartate racemase